MSQIIKCPNCHHEFEPNEAYKATLRNEMEAWKKQQDEKFKAELLKKKEEIQASLQKDHETHTKLIEESLRKKIENEADIKLRLATESAKEMEEKLNLARQREFEQEKELRNLKNKQEELEFETQRKVNQKIEEYSEQRNKREAELRQQMEQGYQMKIKEVELKLEAQKKLADEMQRKADQGSMQLQGEVQELALEELLKATFPFDKIEEVGKGVRGADCIQIIRNGIANFV